MWKILKAELSYKKSGFIIAYVLALIVQIGEFYTQVTSSMLIFFIAIGIMGSQSDKEKRDRLHSMLPIPIKKLAFIRMVFVVVFQLGFLVILISHFFSAYFGKDNSAFWTILIANGFILSVINIFIIYTELGFFNTKKYRFIFLGIIGFILIAVALTLYLGFFRSFFVMGSNFAKSPRDALIFNLICFGMFYLSYVLFIRRKSYLA
ncbi:MAG: hypothetical protein JSW07_02570 [bacterium]|nr:MAG: hypothetical protein JSW07_02570 [bacterium]